MTIITNQWYRFNNKEEQFSFCEQVNTLLAKGHSINPHDWLKYELLKFNGTTLLYRSKEYPQYDGQKAITWSPILKYTIGIQGPKGLKGLKGDTGPQGYSLPDGIDITNIIKNITYNKENTNMKLITISRQKAIDELNNFTIEARKELILNSIAGKSLVAACERINKEHDKKNQVNAETLISPSMLTDSERENLNKIDEEHCAKREEIQERFTELEELYNITETYEQKVALLKRYNVIVDKAVCCEKCETNETMF